MALADIGGILSTIVTGGVLLLVIVLILRNMWKKRGQGGGCHGCSGCSGCGGCIRTFDPSGEREKKNVDRN